MLPTMLRFQKMALDGKKDAIAQNVFKQLESDFDIMPEQELKIQHQMSTELSRKSLKIPANFGNNSQVSLINNISIPEALLQLNLTKK